MLNVLYLMFDVMLCEQCCAQCAMYYVLCVMFDVLCVMFYVFSRGARVHIQQKSGISVLIGFTALRWTMPL